MMQVQCATTDSPVWRLRMTAEPPGQIVFSAAGLGQLHDYLQQAEGSEQCRVVVLEGSDGTFCRGMDLDALTADPQRHASEGVQRLADCFTAWRGSSKATIALVDGAALAGGIGLVAGADMVIATEGSTFALPELVVGLVPALVFPLLCERMSRQKARRFALTGSSIEAAEAREIGLVDRVVPAADQLERTIGRTLKQLLRVKPQAVARLKQFSDQVGALEWPAAIRAGEKCTGEMLSQTDTISAIAGFIDGEPPPWFDRYRRTGGTS